MATIFFRKLLKTVCFDCEMTLFWHNLLKAVCFGQNVFFFGIAGKNSRYCQNSFTYRDSVMGDFQVFGSKWPKILANYVPHCRTQNTYGTLKMVKISSEWRQLQEKINHNQNFK